MKRTDAINELERWLHQYRDFNGLQIEASQILDIVESIGMKPPCVSEDDAQSLMHVYIDPLLYQWDEDLAKDEKVQEMKQRRAEAKARRHKAAELIKLQKALRAGDVLLDAETTQAAKDLIDEKE